MPRWSGWQRPARVSGIFLQRVPLGLAGCTGKECDFRRWTPSSISVFVYVSMRPLHSCNLLAKCRLQRNCGSRRIAGNCMFHIRRELWVRKRKWKKDISDQTLFIFLRTLGLLPWSTSGRIIFRTQTSLDDHATGLTSQQMTLKDFQKHIRHTIVRRDNQSSILK